MNTNRKSKNLIVSILLFLVTLFACLCGMYTSRPAHADMGPKPSVIVTVENLDGRVCYGTLLSDKKSLGPTHAYTPGDPVRDIYDPESPDFDAEEYSIWKAFVEYADPDGYYYQQRYWKCHETGEISWTYYPPSKFKILLYFPDTQTFMSSGIYERFAFHSYFSAKLADSDVSVSQSESLSVSKNYEYNWEIVSLFVRIIATVLIELLVALLFRLRTKKQIITITVVNVITQTALNIALNLLAHFNGWLTLLYLYIPLELAVFVVEAAAYAVILHRNKLKPTWVSGRYVETENPDYASVGKCILFSLVANVVSFAVGFALARVIPGIF